ncbi:hypothetical protein AVEN_86803-1 [Araneus ventricosus]|uniref:Uncharacterized protein n=1 Tax=Araneus ventricosus TaxID=182803 RepID=A0A4Y2D2Y5_ARAVE|nr:hypothetical protein AVEN_86803-1 [Araneus ventricosus]
MLSTASIRISGLWVRGLFEATREPFWDGFIILHHGHTTRTTSELVPLSPNFSTTPEKARAAPDVRFNMHQAHTQGGFLVEWSLKPYHKTIAASFANIDEHGQHEGNFGKDLVILNRGQMTRTTPELAPPLSPNFHATPTGGRLATTYDLTCNRPHTRRNFGGIGFRTWNSPAAKPRPYH